MIENLFDFSKSKHTDNTRYYGARINTNETVRRIHRPVLHIGHKDQCEERVREMEAQTS